MLYNPEARELRSGATAASNHRRATLASKQVRVVAEHAGRDGHEGKVQPVLESEQATPPFVPVERDVGQGLSELTSEEWVREVKERGKQWLTVMLEYVRQ